MTRMVLSLAMMLTTFSARALVPTAALTFDTNVEIINATATQTEKIRKAEELIKRVIATQAFKDEVLNHTYNGVKTYHDNGGYTNEMIYNKILEGAEVLNKIQNNAMDIEVEIYTNNWTSTVGYTYPDAPRIYVNTKFFNSYTAANVTGNLTHEWLHKLGFTHAVSYSTSRDYSVPYAIGRIMEKIATNIATYEDSTPTPTPVALTSVTNLSLTSTSSTVTLRWGAAISSAGIREYKIYRKLEGSTTAYLQGTTANLTFSQSAPSSNSAIYYVKAVDMAGSTKNSVEVKYQKAVLTAVTNLTLTKTTTSVLLNWIAATSTAGIKEYRVYRRLYGSSTAYLQGTTTSLSYSQSKPSVSAAYYVRAVDTLGATAKSIEVSFTR